MKRLIALLSLFGALSVGANAAPILIAYTVEIPTQPGSNGVDVVQAWAEASVATYNTLHDPNLPDVPATSFKVAQGDVNPFNGGAKFDSTTKSITLDLTGYTGGYIVMSWGGSKLPDDKGTADFLYYLGDGPLNSLYFDNMDPLATGGLSGITVWGGGGSKVPDGGATVVLLGLGLVGMSFIARRRVAA